MSEGRSEGKSWWRNPFSKKESPKPIPREQIDRLATQMKKQPGNPFAETASPIEEKGETEANVELQVETQQRESYLEVRRRIFAQLAGSQNNSNRTEAPTQEAQPIDMRTVADTQDGVSLVEDEELKEFVRQAVREKTQEMRRFQAADTRPLDPAKVGQ